MSKDGSWKALGITKYTGKSIPEHIEEVVAEIAALRSEPKPGVPSMTPEQAMERMPWISGRLFVSDPTELAAFFGEVVDALFSGAPVTLISTGATTEPHDREPVDMNVWVGFRLAEIRDMRTSLDRLKERIERLRPKVKPFRCPDCEATDWHLLDSGPVCNQCGWNPSRTPPADTDGEITVLDAAEHAVKRLAEDGVSLSCNQAVRELSADTGEPFVKRTTRDGYDITSATGHTGEGT